MTTAPHPEPLLISVEESGSRLSDLEDIFGASLCSLTPVFKLGMKFAIKMLAEYSREVDVIPSDNIEAMVDLMDEPQVGALLLEHHIRLANDNIFGRADHTREEIIEALRHA